METLDPRECLIVRADLLIDLIGVRRGVGERALELGAVERQLASGCRLRPAGACGLRDLPDGKTRPSRKDRGPPAAAVDEDH
ncbi:MAG: hypothetical protein AAB295_05075, partial [Chloroflexota bacterium]